MLRLGAALACLVAGLLAGGAIASGGDAQGLRYCGFTILLLTGSGGAQTPEEAVAGLSLKDSDLGSLVVDEEKRIATAADGTIYYLDQDADGLWRVGEASFSCDEVVEEAAEMAE